MFAWFRNYFLLVAAMASAFGTVPAFAGGSHGYGFRYGYYAPRPVCYGYCGPIRRAYRSFYFYRPIRRAAFGAFLVGRAAVIGAARIARGAVIGAARIARGAVIGAGRIAAGTVRFALFGRFRRF